MGWYKFFQKSVIWPISKFLLGFFYKIEVRGGENLKGVSRPLIIVSNHRTLFDGFLIGSLFGQDSAVFPIRYMIEGHRFRGAKLEFLRKLGLIKIFSLLTGGFPSGRGEGLEKAIERPLKFLKKGESVLIFPEGKVVREDGIGVFYNGASAIAIRSGASVLPFFIKINPGKISVAIGPAFKLQNPHPISIESGTQLLREKILELSRKV